ncbi:MAG: ATP-binding protein [Erysipelotrichaceae bacterium]|nr:ATP-binding protein [Erysipelotrichaceae bacterium]MDP3304501.1 ATP-binding protein [Erysipelotrichaceae bacterium]
MLANHELDQLIKKLRDMRLPVMADELDQISRSSTLGQMQIFDVLKRLIDEEYSSRKNNTIHRLIKKANFSEPKARLNNLRPDPEREINLNVLGQLMTNQYIQTSRNVTIFGATGSGKSFIANALGVHACEAGHTVRYTRMIELLFELEMSRVEGTYSKLIKLLAKTDLLIIDDFLLNSTTPNEQRDLMEVMEYRSRSKSTILCTQMDTEEWHRKLGGGAIADAILDRVLSKTYTLLLKGDSMRAKVEN